VKHALTLLFIGSAVWLAAQPVIGEHAVATAGTVYGYHDMPWVKVPLQGGENAKWDLSGLPNGSLVAYRWTTTDIAPGAGAFPTNALVLQVPGEPTAYYQRGDTALYWLGTWTESALVRFDPPLAILDLPCGLYTTWRDTGLAVVTGAGRIDMRVTTITARADAWGSLVMPYGVVKDVLRVHHELRVTPRNDPDDVLLSEVRLAWYADRTPMPLLVVTERTGWEPAHTLRWLDGSWQDDPASIFRPIALRAFPDPCDDVTYIDLPASKPDRTVLQLVDGSGQVRKQWPVEFNAPQTRRLTLEMNDVPSGHYTLTWIGTDGTIGNARLQKR